MKQISFSKNLTDKQSKFVDYFVAEGKTQTEAARLAGYSFPEYEGYRLVRQPRMIQVIQAARQIERWEDERVSITKDITPV